MGRAAENISDTRGGAMSGLTFWQRVRLKVIGWKLSATLRYLDRVEKKERERRFKETLKIKDNE